MIMKNIIIKMLPLILGIILNVNNGFAQNYECGTVVTKEMAQKIIENRKNRPDKTLKSSNPVLSVAVRVYVVVPSAGASISESVIQTEINQLNTKFGPAKIVFENCNIDVIKNDGYFNGVQVHNISNNGDLYYTQEFLNLLSEMPDKNMVNIVFTPLIGAPPGIIGTPRGFAEQNSNFILISTSHANNTTLAHEMGHIFGLLHTHETIYGVEKVKRTSGGCQNCTWAGDGFCDTNADKIDSSPYTETCDGNIYTLARPANNLMSYYPSRSIFSTEQIEEMRWIRGNQKPGLRNICIGPELPPTCNDSIKNQGEEQADCGGPCAPCHCSIVVSNAQITNNGSTTAYNVQIGYALVGSTGEIPLQVWVSSSDIIDEIAPNETKTIAPLLHTPDNLDGAYEVRVKIKIVGTDNSCLSTESLNLGIDVPPPVASGDIDLELISCEKITETQSGYSMFYKVQNRGSETIPATKLGVYLSSDEILDPTDLLIKESLVESLGPYYSIYAPISFSVNTASLLPGNVYIILKLDKDNIASETNEDNNICSRKLKGEICDYTIINNTSCEIQTFWYHYDLYLHWRGATIPPFGSVVETIQDGYRWSSTSTSPRIFYETANCASPSYTIDASACTSPCNQADGSIDGILHKDYNVENYILSPSANGSATVEEYDPTSNWTTGKVTFNAGQYISLNPGFTAEYGSLFHAFIGGCEDTGNKVEVEQATVSLRNYPNPFTGQTNIEFVLSKDSPVTLFVSDMTGRKVAMLLDNEVKTEGTHLLTFDGSNYPAGMYYYTIRAGEYLGTQKMILVK